MLPRIFNSFLRLPFSLRLLKCATFVHMHHQLRNMFLGGKRLLILCSKFFELVWIYLALLASHLLTFRIAGRQFPVHKFQTVQMFCAHVSHKRLSLLVLLTCTNIFHVLSRFGLLFGLFSPILFAIRESSARFEPFGPWLCARMDCSSSIVCAFPFLEAATLILWNLDLSSMSMLEWHYFVSSRLQKIFLSIRFSLLFTVCVSSLAFLKGCIFSSPAFWYPEQWSV